MKFLMVFLVLLQPAYADVSGEALFKTYCASCHGTSGEGSAIANFKISKDLSSPTKSYQKVYAKEKDKCQRGVFFFLKKI